MKKEALKTILPLNSDDRILFTERGRIIKENNEKIEELIQQNRLFMQYSTIEKSGDKSKLLFEIPFNAVTFHDLDDKNAYERGGFVNYDVFGIHTIKVYYAEFFNGRNVTSMLKLIFVWNQLNKPKSKKEGSNGHYHSNFDDKNFCFAENYFFQTEEQFLSFKGIYSGLKQLAEEMNLSI